MGEGDQIYGSLGNWALEPVVGGLEGVSRAQDHTHLIRAALSVTNACSPRAWPSWGWTLQNCPFRKSGPF